MNVFINESLKHMLKQHKIWLDSNSIKGKQADLKGAKFDCAALPTKI